MKTDQINMSWIIVSDLKKAAEFFENVVGLKVVNKSLEYNWVEMSGHNGGSMFGIAQESEHSDIQAGANAIVTFTVTNIVEMKQKMIEKGAKMIGDIIEVPGHVKMQFFTDLDGNKFQIVETLDFKK